MPSISAIDFQSPALLKIASVRTTCLSTLVGTAQDTGENMQLSKDSGFTSESKLSPAEAMKPNRDDIE